MSTLLSVHRQKAGKPMKHNGGWQAKEFIYPMKCLVNGNSYTKSYTHSKLRFTRSLSTCYHIILHMKLSLSMEGYLAETRIITDYLGKPIGAIGGGTIALI